MEPVPENNMSLWEKYFPIPYAMALYGTAALGDWISSALGTSVGLLESNPLTRDAFYHFSLWRSLIVDGVYFSLLILVSGAMYVLLHFYSDRLAKFSASVLFTYIGVNRIEDAVIPNIILTVHRLHR